MIEAKLTIGVPKEIDNLEKRVAITPSMIAKFKQIGYTIRIESNAGYNAGFSDEMYLFAGAEIVSLSQV